MLKPCALCGQPVVIAYCLFDHHEEYCSRKCMDEAAIIPPTKKARHMQVPAKDFGTSGVVRHQCDNPKCQRPLGRLPDGTTALSWKGRSGIYCSNRCLKRMEKNMNDVETVETTPTPSPIIAGAAVPAPKKKAAPKAAAPVKKAAPKAAAAPAKKAAKKAAAPAAKAAANNGDAPFRTGTIFYNIFRMLHDGKKHPVSEVREMIAEGGGSSALMYMFKKHLVNRGWKILPTDKEVIQIAKKK